MKRKSETIHQIEHKLATLSPFLKEEVLDVDDIDKDVDDFLDCYNKFVKYVTEVYDKKEKTSVATAAHFILKFKELNRKAQFRLSISREKTKETKDAINKNHLTMQNLLYEALHLEKETNSCLEYKSLYDEIDLVSMEDFKKYAPLSIQNSSTEHELTLNRLHWELIERKNLSTQIDEAERAEQELMEEINKKNEAYNSISTHLRSVFDSTKSLEDIFEMPMHYQETQNDMAEMLPESLYVLYTYLRVHASADEKNMKVTIVEDNDTLGVLVELIEGTMHLSMIFEWNSSLQLMTVLPKLDTSVMQGLSLLTKSLLDSSLLLSELPGDHGSPTNTPWIRSRIALGTVLNPDQGLPYLWCQRLCGIFSDVSVADHRPVVSPPPTDYSEVNDFPRLPTSRTLPQLMEDIRHRIRSRLQLVSEIKRFSANAPSGVTCDWSVSTYTLFRAGDTSTFVSSGLAREQCFYYSGTVKCTGGLVVPLWLVVPHNYPDSHCLVVLNKTAMVPSDVASQQYRLALHLIEVEVNCYCHELSGNILSAQVTRLFSAISALVGYLRAGDKGPLGSLLVGGKFPATKRPFKSL